MSQWRLLMQDLRAAGGGPLPASKFCRHTPDIGSRHMTLKRCRELGLVAHMARGFSGWNSGLWVMTQLGRDYVDGRVVMMIPAQKGSTGRSKGGTMRPVATWLKALPRAGEIRL